MVSPSDQIESLVTHEYAQVNGIRLHYVRGGTGPHLVVLLHGFPECWYSWRHQIAALAGDEYTVVAPDMRGYNLSDKPLRVEDYSVSHLVDDVTGLIRHLGHKDAAVIGHDWGAGVAWAVAFRHPEVVWKLAALQVPPGGAWRRNLTLKQFLSSWYMLFFQLPRLPEWVISRNNFAGLVDAFKKTTASPGVFTDEEIMVYVKAMSQPGALTAALNYYRANFWGRFVRARSDKYGTGDAKVKVPTLFIYGEKDTAVLPSTVRGVADFVDAPYTQVRIPESAHWVQQEAPEKVTAALRDFLSRN
jgi:pimeloyl-ACP methyl ester carboxylesterase